MSLRVVGIIPFQSAYESNEETLRQESKRFFKDIESDLEHTFNGQYITSREEKQFTEYYTELFHVEVSTTPEYQCVDTLAVQKSANSAVCFP